MLEIQEKSKPIQADSCCSTTEDGSAVCLLPQNGESTTCECQSKSISLSSIRQKDTLTYSDEETKKGLWENIRLSLVFTIACLTSPCCTPLLVPLALWLVAGSPIAIVIGQNLGWVYAGLTLISIASFVLLFRWINQKPNLQ